MKFEQFFIRIILLVETFVFHSNSISWLGLYRYARPKHRELEPFNYNECHYSSYHFGIHRRQLRFCLDPTKKFVMHSVVKSAQAVVSYCPKMFKDSRWNCSAIEYLPAVSPDLKRGTREQAIVYALASGALLFEISRRCAMDRISNCPCGKDAWSVREEEETNPRIFYKSSHDFSKMRENVASPDDYIWNGCADNVNAARYFTRTFLGHMRMKNRLGRELAQLRRKRRIFQAQNGIARSRFWRRNIELNHNFTIPRIDDIINSLNGQNYAAGIEIMEKNRRITCKCHGLSGSCTQKVCFRQLLRLDSKDLQKAFKEKYKNSKQVRFDQMIGGFVVNDLSGGNFMQQSLSNDDLAFIQESPDYCVYNIFQGSAGTSRRLCAKYTKDTVKEFDHCQHLCCNRGTYKQSIPTKVPCKCKMTENFQVKCEECIENEVLYFCR